MVNNPTLIIAASALVFLFGTAAEAVSNNSVGSAFGSRQKVNIQNGTPAGPATVIAQNSSGASQQKTSVGCDRFGLVFSRNLDVSFNAIAFVRKPSASGCVGIPGRSVVIESSRGTVSPVKDHGDGIYSALIKPDKKKTGEYVVVATSVSGNTRLRKSKTALVFEEVHKRWGQPQAVEGLVNTLGWEDSAYITPDGEYLFAMYLPVSFSCLQKSGENKSSCAKVRGSLNERNRPGFMSRFAGGRIKADGTIINNCLQVGGIYTKSLLNRYSVYAPPMITYGFKRLPDGSFGKPFPIGIENVSSCVSPSGLDVHLNGDGTAMAMMGLVDPASWNNSDKENYPSLFTANITLGKPNALAYWDPKRKKLGDTKSRLHLMFGKPPEGRQDNPHAVRNLKTGKFDLIFWDSEHDDEDIFYRIMAPGGTFPKGPWGPVKKIPVFSSFWTMEIQPFFDGRTLTVTKRYKVVSRDFLGENYDNLADKSAWGPERTELAVNDGLKGNERGVFYAVGDPTYSTRNGKKTLYFVYMLRHQDGLLDVNIGFVEQK
jgi:hypothetical protein